MAGEALIAPGAGLAELVGLNTTGWCPRLLGRMPWSAREHPARCFAALAVSASAAWHGGLCAEFGRVGASDDFLQREREREREREKTSGRERD
jgi:hypothetical protein